jgi:hypothetical protein
VILSGPAGQDLFLIGLAGRGFLPLAGSAAGPGISLGSQGWWPGVCAGAVSVSGLVRPLQGVAGRRRIRRGSSIRPGGAILRAGERLMWPRPWRAFRAPTVIRPARMVAPRARAWKEDASTPAAADLSVP